MIKAETFRILETIKAETLVPIKAETFRVIKVEIFRVTKAETFRVIKAEIFRASIKEMPTLAWQARTRMMMVFLQDYFLCHFLLSQSLFQSPQRASVDVAAELVGEPTAFARGMGSAK
jgi:hypothetical protein